MISISREELKECKRIIVKVGTSTLTYNTGSLNLMRIEKLARIISNIRNSGKDVVLVSSGAVSAGMDKLGLNERPKDVKHKQAAAAVGQGALINIYSSFFSQYSHSIAQILLTKAVIAKNNLRENAKNTFFTLFSHGVIPIVNENDVISTDEITLEFGDNDTLSSIVAELVEGDLLIILSDIDGLYTDDPKDNPNAKIIHEVYDVNSKIMEVAGGAGTERGTGGMITKLKAAQLCKKSGIKMVIANGEDPYIIEDILNGEQVGTFFSPKKRKPQNKNNIKNKYNM